MPVHFSPSRSLKYCRITFLTVDVSSLSRASASPLLLCLGCKCDLFVVFVFEGGGLGEQAVEEFLHGGELRLRVLECVHARPERRGEAKPLGVPADVLACHPRAAL